MRKPISFIAPLVLVGAAFAVSPAHAKPAPAYNINTLAGKVASVNGTAGLQIRMSAFIQEEADTNSLTPITPDGITLAGNGPSSVLPPDVTVNQDTHGAPQNETAMAVDPNNASRVVGAANDYVTRTWACTVGSTPCSQLGDGYSGTYYSNDGGQTWCCDATDVSHQGSLIPGVDHLSGGPYDAGGDPALAFDSQGNVYYSGLGFDRTSAPNTVAVNKGTFDTSGKLTWGAPTFINQTTSPAVFNDKEWIAADSNPASPFHDRVYVTWTRFIFNAATGRYVQSPIDFAYSKDGGKTFSSPALISGNVLYGQGSRPVVGPDGTLCVFWDGSTRLASLDSINMVKSTDGGVSWSKPVAVAQLADSPYIADSKFRVNSFPAAAVAANGDVYVTWSSEVKNGVDGYSTDTSCFAGPQNQCRSATAYSVSRDSGMTWSPPSVVLSGQRSAPAAADYPIAQPTSNCFTIDPVSKKPTLPCSGELAAPAAQAAESIFPSVATSPNGNVYIGAYVGDVVFPWQSCTQFDPNGSVNCIIPGPYVNNTKLDYVVTDITTKQTQTMTTAPINTRYNFSGSFIGDYTQIAVGPDNVMHAFWTDTNNTATIDWWYGTNFATEFSGGLLANQQDVVTATGTF